MTSLNKKDLIKKIQDAFKDVDYPGDWNLKGSIEGSEPYYLEEDFKGKKERYAIDPSFLDQAPKGLMSALSFFSDEAFRFYIPAYMIADIEKSLSEVDVCFHLTHGLDNKSKEKKVNQYRYGDRSWFDEKTHKFSIFLEKQSNAIVSYLKFKLKSKDDWDFARTDIEDALKNYWLKRIQN